MRQALLAVALACAATHAAAAPRRTILHEFAGASDGNGTAVGLATTADGAIYGVSSTGGTLGCPHPGGCGTIFRLTKPAVPGTPWPLQTLYDFAPGAGGSVPLGGSPTIGPDGALHGTADSGGALGGGVVWQLSPPTSPGGSWTYQVLHSFDPANPVLGVNPDFGVALDAGGTLYGLARGGAFGNGMVFALAPPATPGGAWTETSLYDIPATPIAGAATVLSAGIVLSHDQDDLFGAYGVNALANGSTSTVFALHRGAHGWSASTAYRFAAYGDFSPLLVDAKRHIQGIFFLYGAAQNQFGTIFELSPPAAPGPWSEQDLFTYTYRQVVYGNLARDPKGALFGTIGLQFGEPPDAIFRIDRPAGGPALWTYSLLYTFPNGGLHSPVAPLSLARDPGGNLVGVTAFGGQHGHGVIFRQEVYDHAAP